jgi:hypothetical protein
MLGKKMNFNYFLLADIVFHSLTYDDSLGVIDVLKMRVSVINLYYFSQIQKSNIG